MTNNRVRTTMGERLQDFFRGIGAFTKRWFPGAGDDTGARDANRREPTYAELCGEISTLAGDLESTIHAAEPSFLDLGGTLQSLYQNSEELVRVTQATVQAVGGSREEGVLGKANQVTHQALERLTSVRRDISSSLDDIVKGSDLLGKLCAICPTIENSGMTLNVIGLNIAVESSRSAHAGEMFVVFTDEIRMLSARVLEIARNILDDSRSTRSRQMKAHRMIVKNMESFRQLNQNAETVVRKSLDEIGGIMDFSRTTFESSANWSQNINRLVGDVVVVIQFHDIARQKVEHIVSTLQELSSLPPEERDTAFGRAYKIIGLQINQLGEVISEIRQAHRKCATAFEKMGRHIDELIRDIAVFDAEGKEVSRIRHHITSLQKGLEQLSSLLAEGSELERRIKGTSSQVSETASHLSTHIDKVRGISLDLHLKALNAIVKSARLQEEGRSLEILAQEVSKLSWESNSFVGEVVQIIESLMVISAEGESSRLEDEERESERNVRSGIDQIESVFEGFWSDALTVFEKTRKIESDIKETYSELRFLENLGDNLAGFQGRLQEILNRLSKWATFKDEALDKQLNEVAQRYTMKSERDLHNRYSGDSLPDISQAEADTGDIVLWDDDGESDDPADNKKKKSKAKDEDFGDNVELF